MLSNHVAFDLVTCLDDHIVADSGVLSVCRDDKDDVVNPVYPSSTVEVVQYRSQNQQSMISLKLQRVKLS